MPKGIKISGRIYGKVVDETTKKPLEYISVVAFRPLGRRDSIVGGMLTLSNGEFNIDNLPIGGIKIKVSLIGYKDIIKQINLFPPDLEVDMGDLKMSVDSKLMNELECLSIFNIPILLGVSRKSMIYKTLQVEADQSLNGTTVLNTVGLLKGANILRVHDVKEAVQAIQLTELLGPKRN